ncbi:MAG: diphthine--ammonia ligase [Oscillospiraceae bacterium]
MGKKFVASYSGGKDSILAIYRAINQGMEPVCLIITYNTDKKRSWFHGIPQTVLESLSKSLDIPIWLIKTSGEEYAVNFEKALDKAKNLGAEVCIFGDIDIEGHLKWCTERCDNVGLQAFFPLWGENRAKLVYEFIDSGFTANFTIIDTKRMSDSFLGETLTKENVDLIANQGADICGENGEYHTFVSAGPIFKKQVDFCFGEKIMENDYAVLPIE